MHLFFFHIKLSNWVAKAIMVMLIMVMSGGASLKAESFVEKTDHLEEVFIHQSKRKQVKLVPKKRRIPSLPWNNDETISVIVDHDRIQSAKTKLYLLYRSFKIFD